MADAYDWLTWITLGAALGAAGQGLRITVGLGKMKQAQAAANAADTPLPADAVYDRTRLSVSLAIGAAAGALAAVVSHGAPPDPLSRDALLTLLASGYAGADFIEGAVKSFAPSGKT